jgi:hypothetical protein
MVPVVPVITGIIWYHFCFYIIIIITTTTTTIIIKLADNVTAIPPLELCSTRCSEVTIKTLNHKWATFLLEYFI